jgi:hypothetical protein
MGGEIATSGALTGVRALIPLLVASLVTLAFSVSSLGRTLPASFRGSLGTDVVHKEPRNRERGAIEVGCGRPEALRLRRFEDGSGQLRCGRRLLVRVSVPG